MGSLQAGGGGHWLGQPQSTHMLLPRSGSAFSLPDGSFYNQGFWSEFHPCGARTAPFPGPLLPLPVLTCGFALGAEKMDFEGLPAW